MKKFVNDVAEVGKDIWNGFVWLIDFAYELGEIIADKFTNNKTADVEVMIATDEIKRNVVLDG